MEATNTSQSKSINTALAENLGSYVNRVETADTAEKQDNLIQIDYKMVTFSLAGKDYAVDIMKIKEIAKAGRFTYVPNTLPFVLGVYNLRGDIIPIMDLRLFFNIEIEERVDDKQENLLIVTIGDQTFGVVVDAIDKVVGIQKASIQPPHPLFGDINIKYIQGVVEVNNHLYVLLDIDRIFGSKAEASEMESADHAVPNQPASPYKTEAQPPRGQAKPSQPAPPPAPPKPAKPAISKTDLSFITSSLASMRKFTVSSVNDQWIATRFEEWSKSKGKAGTQLASPEAADEFLKPFYSPCNGTWWTKEYADSVYKVLPDNSAKQIVVWNPGCGKGCETYSLACLLKKRYPSAKMRIYAHEVDLLNVSNAPLLTVPPEIANDWYAPFVTTKVSGEFTFTPEIKNSIMFEYHDCANTNALPVVDIIFARDLLSFLTVNNQNALIADFAEKLKGNGIVFVGQNESLEGRDKWISKKSGTITIYSKE